MPKNMKSLIDNFIPKSYPDGSVTQWFGKNSTIYKQMCVPDVNSPFPPQGQYCSQGHNGIDIVAPWGSPLYAFKGGRVSEVRRDKTGFGRHIRILEPTDKENVYKERVYGHMEDIYVEVGDILVQGDPIGTMGNTGFVVSGATPYWKHNPFAGTHCHLGCRRRIVYPDGSQGGVIDYYNGFYGYYDFKDEFEEGIVVIDETPKEDLTIIGLQNLADQYAVKGNMSASRTVLAVILLVKAFKS